MSALKSRGNRSFTLAAQNGYRATTVTERLLSGVFPQTLTLAARNKERPA